MFFMMGITDGRKDLRSDQLVICDCCGAYGRYLVYVTYTVLSLFFIPVFRWNKRYYVETSCCKTTYELNPEIGRRIERGEQVEIRREDLQMRGRSYSNVKHCSNCGFTTTENFQYCPKCGRPLN